MAADTLVGPDVSGGERLIALLDTAGTPVRSAVWVFDPDRESWRLWLALEAPVENRLRFYRVVGDIISAHRSELPGLDIGDIQPVEAEHPAIVGLGELMQVRDIGGVHLSKTMLNGFFLAEAVVLRTV